VKVIETSLIEPCAAVTVRRVSTGTVAPSVTLVVSCTGAAVVGVADEAATDGADVLDAGALVKAVGPLFAQPAMTRADPAPAKPTTARRETGMHTPMGQRDFLNTRISQKTAILVTTPYT
jgi:hypothetical protein